MFATHFDEPSDFLLDFFRSLSIISPIKYESICCLLIEKQLNIISIF